MSARESLHPSALGRVSGSDLRYSRPPDAPGLSSAHISTQRFHVGGSVAQNRLREASGGRPGGGGLRGEIVEFSRASRRRLLTLLNSINKNEIKRPLFVTLTYPASWPESPREWKKHLERFRSRIVRRYGKFPVIWRLEYQRRGAPHFHLLMFAPLDLGELIPFVARSWAESVASGDDKHLVAGTRCEIVASWRGVNSYAAKYMGKLEQLQPGQESPGRFWGVWYKNLLPISAIETPISVEAATKIRRAMVRYAGLSQKHATRANTLQVFMPDELVIRLLRYYGYYRP